VPPDDRLILVMPSMKPAQNIISPDSEISGLSLRRGLFPDGACDTSAGLTAGVVMSPTNLSIRACGHICEGRRSLALPKSPPA